MNRDSSHETTSSNTSFEKHNVSKKLPATAFRLTILKIDTKMSAVRAKSLTPEDLVDLEIPSGLRISPSGKQIVYAVAPVSKKDKHEISSIWLAEVGKEHSARQITSGLFNDRLPQWSPDGESIAFLSDRKEQGESSAIYQLWLSGGEAFPLTKAESKKGISDFKWSPSGNVIAFLSPDEDTPEKKKRDEGKDDPLVYGENWEHNRLRCVQVATREVTAIYSKDSHVQSFQWSQDSKSIAYALHKNPDEDSATLGVKYERISLISNKIDSICEFPGETWAHVWGEDGLFVLAGFRPSSTNSSISVYKVTLEDSQWTRHAYGETSDVDAILQTGDSVWVKVLQGLSSEIHLLDNNRILYKGIHELDDWNVGYDEGKPILALKKSSLNEPDEVFSYVDGELCQLSQHGAAIAGLDIGISKPFYCKAKDGTDLDAVFMTPSKSRYSKKSGGPWPTWVHPHGGPYWRYTIKFGPLVGWNPWLASAGYAAISPNYRGGSGRGDNFASSATGGMGTKDYDDIISVLEAGIAKGLIDPERVIIGGWSQGGFLSYLAVTRPDFHFRGAICGAGVSDWDMMSVTSDLPGFEAELAGKAPWVEGARESQSQKKGSALWHMQGVTTPILILHGQNDVRVPTSQAIAFHRGCLALKVPCEMVIYPREGHLVMERAHRIDILKRVRRFADLHLS